MFHSLIVLCENEYLIFNLNLSFTNFTSCPLVLLSFLSEKKTFLSIFSYPFNILTTSILSPLNRLVSRLLNHLMASCQHSRCRQDWKRLTYSFRRPLFREWHWASVSICTFVTKTWSGETSDTRLTPADTRLTPADIRLTPADTRLTPADTRLTPADTRLTPADTRLTPADTRLTPADTRLTPADTKLTPADTRWHPLTPWHGAQARKMKTSKPQFQIVVSSVDPHFTLRWFHLRQPDVISIISPNKNLVIRVYNHTNLLCLRNNTMQDHICFRGYIPTHRRRNRSVPGAVPTTLWSINIMLSTCWSTQHGGRNQRASPTHILGYMLTIIDWSPNMFAETNFGLPTHI